MINRMFPIQQQDGAAPHPLLIPWNIAELAYSVYSARFGNGQSLERLADRGGFGPGEMDMFLPGWRDKCSVQVELRTIVQLFLDSIDGAPMASQYFDSRIVQRAKEAISRT